MKFFILESMISTVACDVGQLSPMWSFTMLKLWFARLWFWCAAIHQLELLFKITSDILPKTSAFSNIFAKTRMIW